MAKILDREATIKTAIVEIKALTVSGKQVTLALFRQLQEEGLIDEETILLRGVPWGRVNYHVGCSEFTGPHHHVVWQIGDELRRDIVRKNEAQRLSRILYEESDRWLFAAALHRLWDEEPLLGDGKKMLPASQSSHVYSGAACHLWIDGIRISGWRASYEVHWLWQRKRASDPGIYGGLPEMDYKEVIREVRGHHGLPDEWQRLEAKECLDRYEEIKARAKTAEEEWLRHYTAISNLDQLFIAV